MTLTPTGTDFARERVRRLFAFLRGFNEKRNPIATDIRQHKGHWWWSRIPQSPWIDRGDFQDPNPDEDTSPPSDEDDPGFLLRVRRPELQPPPEPPVDLLKWVHAGWDTPEGDATWDEIREDPSDGTEELSPGDAQRLSEWRSEWIDWADRSRVDYRVSDLFQWLWGVHADTEREGESLEFVLGEGHLTWRRSDAEANHPILLQRVELEYDPEIPQFTVSDADRAPELNAALLRRMAADASAISQLVGEVSASFVHPLGASTTEEFLKTAVNQLDPNGQYYAFEDAPNRSSSYPQIARSPVLFLRSRAQGFDAAIEGIERELTEGAPVPDVIAALVGDHETIGQTTSEASAHTLGDETQDVLLSKEANREQLEIARRLRRYGAVLVQGPPGTGKTHTIANLIGHFLSEGKSVLVTSQTTKALRVLREKVVDHLQPLCVSVLEGDTASNAQLKHAATEIGNRLSSGSEADLYAKAESIRSRRNATLKSIATARSQLLDCVRSEYSAVVVNGEEYAPQDAARLVCDGIGIHDWIPGSIEVALPPPLTEEEARLLYGTNEELSPDDLHHLAAELPDPAALPSRDQYAEMMSTKQLHAEAATRHADLWDNVEFVPELVDQFEQLASATYQSLRDFADWQLRAFDAAWKADGEDAGWHLLLARLRECIDKAVAWRRAKATHGAMLPPGTTPADAERVLSELLQHLRSGKSLGLMTLTFRPSWKNLIQRSSVLNRTPATAEDFEALLAVAQYSLGFEAFRTRWDLLLADVEQLPGSDAEPDEAALRSLEYSLSLSVETLPGQVQELISLSDRIGLRIVPAPLPTEPGAAPALWRAAADSALSDFPDVLASHRARAEL